MHLSRPGAIVKTHARAHLLPLHLLKLLSSVAAGQPIQVFINLPLSEISDIDDQHSVSMALRKHVLYVFLTIHLLSGMKGEKLISFVTTINYFSVSSRVRLFRNSVRIFFF